ncbi:MAG: hypothetical protein EKK59_04500 [Neisseriaceae bacterium]|nr:MAG: hypothetical protein EKK59_04500 [Neisseriaceae bacterium]
MTTELTEKLDVLGSDADYSDPNTYATLLYSDGVTEEPPKPGEGVTNGTAAAPTAAPAAPAAAPAETTESSATPAAAPSPVSEVVDGVLTKDGKRVIPFSVLDETRKTAQANAQRAKELVAQNERMQAELEALRAANQAGNTTSKTAAAAVEPYSEERIAEVRDNFPEMADLMQRHNALVEQVAKERAAPQAPAPSAPAPAASTEDQQTAAVQSLIDQRPLLAQWQAQGSDAWDKAVALDAELREDPAWQGKSPAERFAAVEASIAARYGLSVPSATPAPAPAAAPATPSIPADRQAPPVLPTLSDFGGTPVVSQSDLIAGLTNGQAVDKMREMSVEEIRKFAGLSY